MPSAPEQLVFELPHRAAIGREDFLVSDSNAAAVALVDRWPDWPVGAAVLVGPKGSGKTHLANVWLLRSAATVFDASQISREDVPAIASAGAAIIEDIQNLNDEAALFHLLNLVREQRLQILLTTDIAPGDLSVALPDLMSRLKALPLALDRGTRRCPPSRRAGEVVRRPPAQRRAARHRTTCWSGWSARCRRRNDWWPRQIVKRSCFRSA